MIRWRKKNQNYNRTMWLGPRAKYEWKIDDSHQNCVQLFNMPTFLPNPFQRITAYGMTNECCKIYLQKLWLFSPPSTYKLTVNVTSYTWKKGPNRRLNVYVLMSSQPWRMPKACISWLVLAGDLVRSEWWLKRFHSPRKEVFILHVLSLVRFNDLYFLCTDWCHLHVFQSEKMRLLTII